jgi:tetratricopeptide (TPR) repeat protein
MGKVYSRQGNLTEALKYEFSAQKLFEELNDKEGISNCYFSAGTALLQQDKIPEALKKYLSALKIKEELGAMEYGWDGTWNGMPQDAGTYFYMITVARLGQENVVYKGDVTLIR